MTERRAPSTAETETFDPARMRLWHVLFVVGACGIAVLAVWNSESPWRWVAVPAMATLLLWYRTMGLRVLRADYYRSGTALVFAAGVVACVLPVFTIAPGATFGMFVIAPVLYMTAGVTWGTVAVGTLMVVPDLVRVALGLLDVSLLPIQLPIYAVVLLFSHWCGSWITRVIMQSEERAQLIAELRRSQVEIARLSEETGAMAERERLAREIHDTLAQGFTSIITLAQAVESELDSDPATARRHIALMRETAQENLVEARALVAARTPVHLDAGTLEESLDRIGARLGTELGIDVRTEVAGTARPLPPPAQVGLLRAAQEALANVRKHAAASRVTVTLAYGDGRVRLAVHDDGRGFDPDSRPLGHGLGNIRHRVEQVGGSCEVRSSPGAGTEIELDIPLPAPGVTTAPRDATADDATETEVPA